MVNSKIPTATELAILQVLWQFGPLTVREVHEHLAENDSFGYTSVLKMLQVMHKKGLVMRDEQQRSHIYRPAKPAEQTQQGLIRNLVDSAFAGSASDLVVRALSARSLSRDDVKKIRAIIDEKAKGRDQ